jgi:hypothetical protein
VRHNRQFLQHNKLAAYQQEVMLTLNAASHGRDSGGIHNRGQYGGYQHPPHQQRHHLQQSASPRLQLQYDDGQQQRRRYHPNNGLGQQQGPGSYNAQSNYGNHRLGEMGVGAVPWLRYHAPGIGSHWPDSQRLQSDPDGKYGGDHCDGMLSGEDQIMARELSPEAHYNDNSQ